jgi:hypothetical protein
VTLVFRLIHVFQITGNTLVLLNTIDDHSSSVTAGTKRRRARIDRLAMCDALLQSSSAPLARFSRPVLQTKASFSGKGLCSTTRLDVMWRLMCNRATLSQAFLRHVMRHVHVVAAAHAAASGAWTLPPPLAHAATPYRRREVRRGQGTTARIYKTKFVEQQAA